jgi:D-alanyl-D-alanine carboxypeptidase
MKFWLLGVLLGTITAMANANLTNSVVANLKNITEHTSQKYKISAITMSIILPNSSTSINVVVGNVAEGSSKAVQADNLVPIASITKTFTASMILQLEAEGKLNIHDSICKYLPQYPNWCDISIQQLLDQTSGLYDISDGWFGDAVNSHQIKPFTPDEIVTAAYNHKLYFSPGQGWKYANTNYVLLGMIIERVTGDSYRQSFDKLINALGLTQTYYVPDYLPSNIEEKIVHGYDDGRDVTHLYLPWLGPAGAVISTPADLAIWSQSLFSGKLLPSKQQAELLSFVSVANGKSINSYQDTGYGLSLFRMNTPVGVIYFTPGTTMGYRAMTSYMPCTGITLAYILNDTLLDNRLVAYHEMLMESYKALLAMPEVQKQIDIYKQNNVLPTYCPIVTPTKTFDYPKI